jgi:membrane protein DedA with SNARE-associated domain
MEQFKYVILSLTSFAILASGYYLLGYSWVEVIEPPLNNIYFLGGMLMMGCGAYGLVFYLRKLK